jgi:hypothetical protein
VRCRSFRNRRIGWDLDSFCSILADQWVKEVRKFKDDELQAQANCIIYGWD